jgi:hypothetical protein
MNISYDELSEMMWSIEERDFWDTKIELLKNMLEQQYQAGVQEGMKLAALFSTGSLTGIASPNSFAASRDEAIDADNSDDLYVN